MLYRVLFAALAAFCFQPAPNVDGTLRVKLELSPWELQAVAVLEAPDVAPFLSRRLQKRIALLAASEADPDTARQLRAFAEGGPSVLVLDDGVARHYGGVRHLIPPDEWGAAYAASYAELELLGPRLDENGVEIPLPDGSPGTPLRAWVDAWFGPGGGFGR